MSVIGLDAPWATMSLAATPHEVMTGVDVLPGYASDATAALPAMLSKPWSRQTLAILQQPAIRSLNGVLSD
jgi:hypothetical protein